MVFPNTGGSEMVPLLLPVTADPSISKMAMQNNKVLLSQIRFFSRLYHN